jgi:hypothetical protein
MTPDLSSNLPPRNVSAKSEHDEQVSKLETLTGEEADKRLSTLLTAPNIERVKTDVRNLLPGLIKSVVAGTEFSVGHYGFYPREGSHVFHAALYVPRPPLQKSMTVEQK